MHVRQEVSVVVSRDQTLDASRTNCSRLTEGEMLPLCAVVLLGTFLLIGTVSQGNYCVSHVYIYICNNDYVRKEI